MTESLDRVATRFLTRRYLLALALIATLTVAAQAVIQSLLRRQRDDAAVINLAGRQRMLSQELVKALLARRLADDPAAAEARSAEAGRVLSEWSAAHGRLSVASGMPGIGLDNSPAVAAAFIDLGPSFDGMRAAAQDVRDPEAPLRLLALEGEYLRRMDAIVARYEAEASARVGATMALEVGLSAVLLSVLVIEAWCVFRPAVRWLRATISSHERLREQMAITREQAAAAGAARRIGYDLHDGVGQTLTALTLQARLLESAVPAAIPQRIAALRDGITDALVQMRAAAACLAPVDVGREGLAVALERLAASISTSAGVDCRADCARIVLPPANEELYRIAQEAVANAMRHGRARSITITLATDRDHGVLAVDDNGTAGDAAGLDDGEGLGLRSMRHRAARLGGSLAAGARQEGGWRVECRFPLGSAAAP